MSELDVKINFYDHLYKWILLVLALVTTTMVVIGVRQVFVVGRKIDLNVQSTQTIISNNQQSTLEARKANEQRQEDLKNYTKCIVLLPYDHPEFLATRPTREQAVAAMDKCAKP